MQVSGYDAFICVYLPKASMTLPYLSLPTIYTTEATCDDVFMTRISIQEMR